MDGLINTFDAFLGDYFELAIPDIHITDIIEVLIISFVIYEVLVWVKNTRAWMLLRGLAVIVALFILAAILQMNTILWLGERFVSVAFIAIVIVFQPELRHALEHLGRNNILLKFIPSTWTRTGWHRFDDRTLNDLVKACYDMGAVKTGALIVIEQEVQLTEFERTGIPLDSLLSRQLLLNIFEKNTPLHDGAIIVRGDRIISATCYLPLSDNLAINKELGTRHRAAIGVSEVSDALTIVVSEETGAVSVAVDGEIHRNLDEEGLRTWLHKIQMNATGERSFRKRTKEVS